MPDADLPRLETLIAGGERCTADLVQRWAPGREFFNAYGPTEGTVTATMWRCREDDAEDPPIGVPRDQAEVFILDDDLQPVPTGSCGELCLAGTGLARGYLNREELTKERFVFQAVDGPSVKRLYKTGDIGRLRTDGAVEFVGRRDRQVKVRGFRVEMNEVESCLRGHPQIAQAAVRQSANDGSHVRLLAFYVPEKDQSINVWQLRDWVGGKLPEYMIPAHFVSLDALTYDMNGKIDYEALLPLLNELPTSGTGRVPPRSRLEVVLSEIWCEVLGVDEVGIHDHFVELGGDSLVSVQIANQANERGLSLTSSQVFEHPTIAELAEFLES
jgi:acyl-coenzyme A synthetase/AMP-(fatty) acid ligase/aryl carrier-like protein